MLVQLVLERKAKANLERECCADGHENDHFDTATPSILELYFDSNLTSINE